MILPVNGERVPLRLDEDGTVRVGNTRITLDLIVEQYENGMTPEDMVRAYDTLKLADVYGALACYLHHQEEVSAYLRRRDEEAATLQAEIENERPRIPKDELIARRSAMEQAHASTGQ
jgi:uncharacterized protein (DUF433 family)